MHLRRLVVVAVLGSLALACPGGASAPVDAGPRFVITRTSWGWLEFDVVGPLPAIDLCAHPQLRIERLQADGGWARLPTSWPDVDGDRFIDLGPPPARNLEEEAYVKCCNPRGAQKESPRSYRWSGNMLGDGGVVTPTPAGRHRVVVKGLQQEFTLPLP